MFLTMALTSAMLTWTHFQHREQIMAYVAAETSYLLSISQLTQAQIPGKADRDQALHAYMKAMNDAGFSSIAVATPTGEVIASTNPSQVGKKISIRKRKLAPQEKPIRISAELRDLDPESGIEQKPFLIQFPIVQGEHVIGYAQVRGEADEVEELLRRYYTERLYWILVTMSAALVAVVYLAFRFTKPIEKLAAGAEQVAQGNLAISLPVKGSDEMARLAETFNRMVERLRENRQLQERLNEAEKLSLLGRFAATIAHEVRNSLNFINLSIDQIRAKHAGGEERAARELQRNLRNIKDEISRLNRLVNDFLAAGRQAPPELAPFDLRATLEEAVALVDKQASRQGIDITLELARDLPELRADSSKMKTCFLNILTNAVQAMPRGGRITVSVQRHHAAHGDSELLQIRFADTGPGIPAEDRERVFAPYYSTKTTGFGLGLAITRKIVDDHGGRIFVAEGEELGTRIVIELPIPAAPLAPSVVAAKAPAV